MPQVASCSKEDLYIEVTFEDGERGRLPFLWLRDNCRCDDCYDFTAIARKYAPLDLKMDIEPTEAWIEDGKFNVTWTDGHHSSYDNAWLYQKGLTCRPKPAYQSLFEVEKEVLEDMPHPERFEYSAIVEKEDALYEFLKAIEKRGIAIVKNAPSQEGSGPKFLEKIAFPKMTQFGILCTVRAEKNHSYPAFTTKRLGLHTDLSYYENCPGIILIHFLKQPKEDGGESLLVDGYSIAERLRVKHPNEFKMLTNSCTYFYDRANPKYDCTTSNKHKINKTPIIKLNDEGNVTKITFDNSKRDATIDLPANEVASYYGALKTFHSLIYEHAKVIKMEEGDIVVLDNNRMLHGRKAYGELSGRHLEVSYLDWDEAKSRRRCLEEKLHKSM